MKQFNLIKVVIAVIALLATSLACGLFTNAGAPSSTQPSVSQPSQVATLPPSSASTEAPTAVPATSTQETQKFFTDKFDHGISDWSPFVTHGDISQLDLSASNGQLDFNLKDRQLWTYLLYKPQTYDDVRIDVQVENRGSNENNISLICRYNQDRGWYEVSIANSGLYWIYYGKWDSNGTTASYANVANGGSNKIHQGPATNTYAMVCKGNMISVSINNSEIKRVTDNSRSLGSGQIGIGVSSFRLLPVEVDYDWVKVSQP